MSSVKDHFTALQTDPWRDRHPFGADFAPWHERVLQATDEDGVQTVLTEWLQRHQPCLFGRLAAKTGAITFCVLNEHDLTSSDEEIASKIQSRRLHWYREAYFGRTSAFIVIAVSGSIALAQPNDVVAALAVRLAFLYLRKEIEFDNVYTDEIHLEFPGDSRLTRQWPVGVNYFCAQADGRWWRDHRIPGGMAFSMNSVGHLVRSGRMQNAFDVLSEDLESGPPTERKSFRIDSLEKALEFAMRTIALAAPTDSGPATRLLDLPADPSVRSSMPACPVDLPGFLQAKDHCTYWGGYHTDVTLPTEYFTPDVDRPSSLRSHQLDFTYLFHRSIDNPDFELMGEGRRIRSPGGAAAVGASALKRSRAEERMISIEMSPILKEALGSAAPQG